MKKLKLYYRVGLCLYLIFPLWLSSCSVLNKPSENLGRLNYRLTVDLFHDDNEHSLIPVLSEMNVIEILETNRNAPNSNLPVQRVSVLFRVDGVAAFNMFRTRLSASGLRVVQLVQVFSP